MTVDVLFVCKICINMSQNNFPDFKKLQICWKDNQIDLNRYKFTEIFHVIGKQSGCQVPRKYRINKSILHIIIYYLFCMKVTACTTAI